MAFIRETAPDGDTTFRPILRTIVLSHAIISLFLSIYVFAAVQAPGNTIAFVFAASAVLTQSW